MDASSETPYSERDEEFSNTIAEHVPGVQNLDRLTTHSKCLRARQ